MTGNSLEKIILEQVRQIKFILNGQASQQSEEQISTAIDRYRTKEGDSLYVLAQKQGISKDEFLERVKYVAGKKYSLLYALNRTLDGLEKTLLGATGPGIGLDNIAMKLSGRTELLPVLLVVYSVHKIVDDIGAQWTGVYSRDIKGGLTYNLDELIRQTRFLGRLAGIGTIVDKLTPSFENRIEKAAIRDMEYWIKTGTDPSPGYKADITKLISYTRGKIFDIENKFAEYKERHIAYGTDHVPAERSGYQTLQPVSVQLNN